MFWLCRGLVVRIVGWEVGKEEGLGGIGVFRRRCGKGCGLFVVV